MFAAAIVALGGCASNKAAVSPEGLMASAASPAGVLRAADVYAHPGADEKQSRYRVVSGSLEGETLVRESRPLDEKTWLVVERRARNDEALTEDTLRVADDGAVVLVSSVDFAERVLTTFEPPLTLMPATLNAGETHSQTLRVRIHPVDNPDRERDGGEATHELTFDAVQTLQVGGAPVQTRRLRTELSISLRVARVRSATDLWIDADGEARIVARRSDEQARAFGVPVRSVSRLIVAQD